MLRSHELKLFTQDSGRDTREGVAWGMEEQGRVLRSCDCSGLEMFQKQEAWGTVTEQGEKVRGEAEGTTKFDLARQDRHAAPLPL